jgi:hypothetical protein
MLGAGRHELMALLDHLDCVIGEIDRRFDQTRPLTHGQAFIDNREDGRRAPHSGIKSSTTGNLMPMPASYEGEELT